VIRPAINLATTTSGTTPACILVSSVETFDTSSSVVHAVINPPAVTQRSGLEFPGASRRNFRALTL
jgi:hypothetical protein